MNEIYENQGSPKERVIEEIGEVLQAIGKGERFGWDNKYGNNEALSNFEQLKEEYRDLSSRMEDYLNEIENNIQNKNSLNELIPKCGYILEVTPCYHPQLNCNKCRIKLEYLENKSNKSIAPDLHTASQLGLVNEKSDIDKIIREGNIAKKKLKKWVIKINKEKREAMKVLKGIIK